METPELKPCPFCGSGKLRIIRALTPFSRQVYCGKCKTEGPHGRSDKKAVELWNARAEVKAKEKGATDE